MKSFRTLSAIVFFFLSCKQSASPSATGTADNGFKQTPLVTNTPPAGRLLPADTTLLIVDSMVNITMNGKPLDKKENNVYDALYNNWMQVYAAGKHVPVALKMITQGTVMMGARGNITDDIMKAQEAMKNYIAKDMYSNAFLSLTARQKQALQQAHPLLFQKDFH